MEISSMTAHHSSNKLCSRSRLIASIREVHGRLSFHAYSIWLFTFSDLKTIVFPQTAFGILSALSKTGPITADGSGAGEEYYLFIARRIPLVLFWVWLNLLPFEINNQNQPQGIEEDRLNKPWRTMPSNRWSPRQATNAMLFFYFVAIGVSWHLGGIRWSLSLVVLGIWYNNMGGSDVNPFIRNLINALGYISFAAGALETALDEPLRYDWAFTIDLSKPPTLETWLMTILSVILTTVHTQDMEDQEGDALRGRRSLPLQIGDGPCRWVTAVSMSFWGIFCPLLWGCGWLGYVCSISLAFAVASRSLVLRNVEADKTTFKIWNLWIVCIYTLPLITKY
ncbi:UbiA prenyltransferase family [Poronia punctata]|nr:UbiA prenyltransferase family [Poronia punctata]